MEDKLAKLKSVLEVQCSDGVYKYDPYMHGMANGLILAQSIMEDTEPIFLEAPTQWISNQPKDDTDGTL